MTLVPVDDSNRAHVLSFLVQYEKTCVTLTENVRRKSSDIFALTDNKKNIRGIIGARHTVLHCLPGIVHMPEFKTDIAAFLSNKTISCINGEAEGTRFLVDTLGRNGIKPVQENYYMLMTMPYGMQPPVNAALPSGWRILHCHEKNVDELMNLQSAYEKEEVLPSGRRFMPSIVRQNLEHIIKSEYLIALCDDKNTFIAKANTNAIGIQYVQIGGVYTDPRYRGNHYASLLVSTLVRKINTVGKRPVLFVKNSNSIAKKLYLSLGFIKSADFLIAYF
jgi:hypothetical protein